MAGAGTATSNEANSKLMTERLTEWEIYQLESIGLVFKQAVCTHKEFKDEKFSAVQSDDNPTDISSDWLKFRSIMIDLYSVLDYTYFLLYCHFANKGKVDHSHATTMQNGFPYRFEGLKFQQSSDNDSEEKREEYRQYNEEQRRTFIEKYFKFLNNETINLGEDTHFWKVIADEILAVQPKLPGKLTDDKNFEPTGRRQIPIETTDAESFAILHHYRNCATHRGLIRFEEEEMYLEYDRAADTYHLVKAAEKKGNTGQFFYTQCPSGYFLQIPEDVTSTKRYPRMLLEVLDQLVNFVKNTTSKLLAAAFLLDKMPAHLRKNFVLVDIQYFPQVSMELTDDVTSNILKLGDLFMKKINELTDVTVDPAEFKPVEVENKTKYFKGWYKLTIKYKNKDLITLSSKEYEKRGTDDVESAGIKEVLEECIRLGIIVVMDSCTHA